jgi:hypothetical protein
MSKVLLQSAIAKTVGAGRNKGMSQPVLGREEPFNRHVRISKDFLRGDIANKTSFSYLWRMALL